MEQQKQPTVAILLASTQNEYSDDLIEGFYTCAKEENVNLIFLLRATSPFHEHEVSFGNEELIYNIQFGSIFDYVPAIKPDALIVAYGSLCGRRDVPIKRVLTERYGDVPILFIEDNSGDPNVPYVIPDNYGGMYRCVEHLVRDHGYRKVAFVAGPKKNFESNERLRAYRDVCAAYGLEVPESYVVYGDYSEHVDEKVELLLDRNPGLQAIAFANDNMAKAGYRVCADRNLMVGRDLAITGFDDVSIARTMTPPLTSVMHSSFLYSYEALQNALALIRGEECAYRDIPTHLCIRESCGCSMQNGFYKTEEKNPQKIQEYIRTQMDILLEELFFAIPFMHEKEKYTEHLNHYFDVIYQDIFAGEAENLRRDLLIYHINELCKVRHISSQMSLEKILELTRNLMNDTWKEKMRSALAETIELAQRTVHSHVVLSLQDNTEVGHLQSWFLSSFMAELLMLNSSASDNMRHILMQIQRMNIPATYFFLYEDPVYNHGWSLPEHPTQNLALAGYYNEDGLYTAETLKQEIVMEQGGGVCAFLKQNGKRFYFTFPLFSGDEQYGIMVCEIEPKDVYFMLSCSMQLGTLLQVLRIDEAEKEAQRELKESLELIREKNAILSSISENDELTGLFNRRGFVEKAIYTIKENTGKQAWLLFGDLDHLKEINDSFGHNAGDTALRQCGEYLRNALPKDAIISRFGGDEYVALVTADEDLTFGEECARRIKRESTVFNSQSSLDFYIEMSVGISGFLCAESVDLRELLQQSDKILYLEKQKRRESIRK